MTANTARARARRDLPMDAEQVIGRLEEAGMTMLALPSNGHLPRLRTTVLNMVRSASESYGWTPGRLRPPVPSAERISRMDEALDWFGLIPQDQFVLRRIVSLRAMVDPITERHVYSWRRVGMLIGADHKAVQRWHATGIDVIVGALRQAASPPVRPMGQGSASGWREGCAASAQAVPRTAATAARMAGNGARSTPNRSAEKSCGTRQQSSKVTSVPKA